MTLLQLPVPETTARRFNALSVQQQNLVSQLVADCLEEGSKLTEIMDFVSYKAQKRGLTPEILDQLLAEE